MSEPSEVVVAIVGCATVGSEIAAVLAEAGATVLAIDAAARPYGELESQVPAWHATLVGGQIGRIDENLAHPNITFVPKTALGRDVSRAELAALGVTVIETTGREHTDDDHARLVRWFNHRGHLAWPGPDIVLPPRVVVIGEDLAAFETARLVSIELHHEALADRGLDVGLEALARDGIAPTLTRLRAQAVDVSVTLVVPGGLDRLLSDAPPDLRGAALDALRTRDLVKVLPGFDVGELVGDTLRLVHSGDERLELTQPCDLLVDTRTTQPPAKLDVLHSLGRLRPPGESPFAGSATPPSEVPLAGSATPPGEVPLLPPTLSHKLWEARLIPARNDEAAIVRGEALAEALGTAIRSLVQPLITEALANPSPTGTTQRALTWAKARHAAVGYTDYGDWIGTTRRRWL